MSANTRNGTADDAEHLNGPISFQSVVPKERSVPRAGDFWFASVPTEFVARVTHIREKRPPGRGARCRAFDYIRSHASRRTPADSSADVTRLQPPLALFERERERDQSIATFLPSTFADNCCPTFCARHYGRLARRVPRTPQPSPCLIISFSRLVLFPIKSIPFTGYGYYYTRS